MPEAASEVIQARILRFFPKLINDLGGNPAAILSAHGLDEETCEQEAVVTCRQWVRVLEHAAAVLGVADIGMRLAERQGGTGVFGALGQVMQNCHTLGESLSYAATHNSAHCLAARVWMGRTASGRSIFMGHELLAEELSTRQQAVEHILLAGHLAVGDLTGGRTKARRVHFRHQATSSIPVYHRHFRCDVRFCCNEDGIAFTAADLAAPILERDEGSFDQLLETVEQTYGTRQATFAAQVRGVVMPMLWTGMCCVEDVARVLKVHPRALHRRLQAEGCLFQSIKDEVRSDILLYYLKRTELPLGKISEKLGFSEQSAMTRFARARLHSSPRELRRGFQLR